MKKLVASLLAVATVASMASMTAFADGKFIAEVGDKCIYDDDKTVMTVNEIQPDETFYIGTLRIKDSVRIITSWDVK